MMAIAVGDQHPLPRTAAGIHTQEMQQSRGLMNEIQASAGRLAAALTMAAQEAALLEEFASSELIGDTRNRISSLNTATADTILAMRTALEKRPS